MGDPTFLEFLYRNNFVGKFRQILTDENINVFVLE